MVERPVSTAHFIIPQTIGLTSFPALHCLVCGRPRFRSPHPPSFAAFLVLLYAAFVFLLSLCADFVHLRSLVRAFFAPIMILLGTLEDEAQRG